MAPDTKLAERLGLLPYQVEMLRGMERRKQPQDVAKKPVAADPSELRGWTGHVILDEIYSPETGFQPVTD